MTDFSQVSHEDTVQEEAVGGGFTITPPEDGPALLRLREVIELGMVQEEYDGKPKKNLTSKIKIVFEIVHAANGSHVIAKDDGTFIRNKDITLYLNKSFNEKAKYRKLFEKMNYAGTVPIVKGEKPSMHLFLGSGYLCDLKNNVSEKNGKTYTNIDNASGEFTVRRAAVPVTDPVTQIPTGEVTDIAVPEMSGEQACFLWGTSLPDEMLQLMWESIDRGTYVKDDVEHSKSFERMDIMDPEVNLKWEGSREQALFAGDAIDAAIEETVVDPLAGVAEAPEVVETSIVSAAEEALAAEPAVDPLAALGV